MIKKINIPSYFDMGISFDGIHRYANNGTFYYMIQVKQKKREENSRCGLLMMRNQCIDLAILRSMISNIQAIIKIGL